MNEFKGSIKIISLILIMFFSLADISAQNESMKNMTKRLNELNIRMEKLKQGIEQNIQMDQEEHQKMMAWEHQTMLNSQNGFIQNMDEMSKNMNLMLENLDEMMRNEGISKSENLMNNMNEMMRNLNAMISDYDSILQSVEEYIYNQNN